MNEYWLVAIALLAISIGWVHVWLLVMLVMGKMHGKAFLETLNDSTMPNQASVIALAIVAIVGMAAMLTVVPNTRDRIGLLCIFGLFATTCVSAYYWERLVYRLTPFAGATIVSFILGWTWEKPYLEVLKIVVFMNVATGLLLGAWWLEERSGIRKKSQTG